MNSAKKTRESRRVMRLFLEELDNLKTGTPQNFSWRANQFNAVYAQGRSQVPFYDLLCHDLEFFPMGAFSWENGGLS